MLITALSVSGCGVLPGPSTVAPDADRTDAALAANGTQRPQARPDAIAAPSAPDLPAGALGRTVASLGNPAEQGLWLKTPLVSAVRPGRISSVRTDKSVAVTLIPIEGPDTAGSRLSLAAMQAMGVSLSDLVEVDVFGT